MTDNIYNGWTNYATWRVNLEMFDGMSPEDICGETPNDVWQLETAMKEYALETIDHAISLGAFGGPLVDGWARAFLADVNWTELANHKMEEYQPA